MARMETQPQTLLAKVKSTPETFWTRLKIRWARTRTRLMLIFAAIMAAIGSLQAADIVPLFPPEYARFSSVLAPILVAVLHVITADKRVPKE